MELEVTSDRVYVLDHFFKVLELKTMVFQKMFMSGMGVWGGGSLCNASHSFPPITVNRKDLIHLHG